MRVTRVFVNEPIAVGLRMPISGNAANHISRVLRLRVGDFLTLFDGSGGEYAARVEEMRKDVVFVSVSEHRALERESPLQITLAQGVSRGERMDLVIQKATELGVHRIVPVLTERSVVKLDARQAESKLQHWRAVAVAACEQCGRNRVPDVHAPINLNAFLTMLPAGQLRLILSPTATRRIATLERTDTGVMMLIGPEGGLAEAEQEAAISAGFDAISLGPRILRTETAAIAAIAAIQHRLGDL